MRETNIHEPTINFNNLIKVIISKWYWFLISITIAVAIALVVNRYSERVYIASALIVKDSQNESANVQNLLYGKDVFKSGYSNVANEMAVINSFDLIEETLKELNFSVSYYNNGTIRKDELYTNSPIIIAFDTSRFSQTPYNILLDCEILDREHYTFRTTSTGLLADLKNAIRKDTLRDLPYLNKKFEFGEIYEIEGFRFTVYLNEERLDSYADNHVFFRINKYNSLLNEYRRKLEVEPYDEEASIIRISLKGNNRKKILDYLNKHIDKFINGSLSTKNSLASKSIDFINDQILAMADSLTLIESQLETLKKTNSAIQARNTSEQIFENSQALEDERNLLTLNNEYLGNLQSYLTNDQLDKIFLPSSLGITDPGLNRSIQQLVDLRLEVQVMQSDKNLSNPLIRIKNQQINGLKNNISEIIKGLIEANNLRINNINQSISSISSSMRNIPTAERKLDNIMRMHDLSEDMYLFLMQKKAEAGIARASNSVDYRVIDRARSEGIYPVSPNPSRNLATAIILGMLIPGGFIFLREVLNKRIRTKKELTELTSIPLLGSIVNYKSTRKKKIAENQIIEGFRMIRSNIRYLLNSNKESAYTFLVTSFVSGEGKTYCSTNLALMFSSLGQRVLLISLDMRKRETYKEFEINPKGGLSEFLANKIEYGKAIKNTNKKNLQIIPAGDLPPNPTELLLNGKLDWLIQRVKNEYDYIIFDSPPVGILADAMELMQKTDLNIFVIRADYTLKENVLDMEEKYRDGFYKNLALLLNSVDLILLKSGYYNYGYQVSNKDQKQPVKKPA